MNSMTKKLGLALLTVLIMVGLVLAQTPPTPPILNAPDDPPCVDPTDTAVCSQDFYWNASATGPAPDWYEVFRRTLIQTGGTTAWVKVGNAYPIDTRWWTANDSGDSEVNAAGEVRAGQQKPGFMYEYKVRSCRLIPDTWDIKCSSFSIESVFFQGVVYNRTTG